MIAALGFFLFAQAARADWTPAKRLTWTAGTSQNPAVAVDSSAGIHVVWQDDAPGDKEIYYKRSTDGGTTWTTSQRLTWTAGTSRNPAIAVDASNNLHVVWDDDQSGGLEIYYMKSTDGGTSWSASQRLSWTSISPWYPAIAIDSFGSLYVVWHDWGPGNNEIYYIKSPDGGTTWTSTHRLTWTSGSSTFPAIYVDSLDGLHLVWQDDTPGNNEVYYKKSADGGAAWTTSKRLSWTSNTSQYPATAADSSGNPHVVWYDLTPGNREIYTRKSTDGGTAWTTSQRLTWTTGGSFYPVVSPDSSGNIHVVWKEYLPGNYELYHRKSSDGGMTWMTKERLTWTSGESDVPAIAADSSGGIHVVWPDLTPGNYEIYYKKGT
jgi:hypothetical protein